MDFCKIVERSVRKGEIEIYPDFVNEHVKDLLVRGGAFYAVWDEKAGMWTQDILEVSRMVDEALWERARKRKQETEDRVVVKTMSSDASGMWIRFNRYLKTYPNAKALINNKLTFANTEVRKEDYVSQRLPYALEEGDYSAWDRLVGRLYAPEERAKIEWAIGAIVSGDSKKIQKFCVFYGEPGAGKGTILGIIKKLFDGYYVIFDAKSLGSASNQFSLEMFRSNPLVGLEMDGDLSRIEDNTRLNTIVSHEEMIINEKGKTQYPAKMNCFLFLGTNRPVKITDAKSGIKRRLIDIHPSNKLFGTEEYDALMSQIDFQLGAIAYHCLEVYKSMGKDYYKHYEPMRMVEKTDPFFNFVEYCSEELSSDPKGISVKRAYAIYKDYCEDALMEYKKPRYLFKEELKNYFLNYDPLIKIDGQVIRSWYSGFRWDRLQIQESNETDKPKLPMELDSTESKLDILLADCPAQYATLEGAPRKQWKNVETKLKDLDTKKLHYVIPSITKGRKNLQLIMIDFDIRNEKGEKDMLLNLQAASKFPRTYAEFSKGGAGIHLIYWYDGDTSKLAPLYSEGVEVKTFRGNAAMRRRLSKCNNRDVAIMAQGALPVKEEKMLDTRYLQDELHLRNIIKKCLRKENHGATRPEVDLIKKVTDEAWETGMHYDVTDLQHDILLFAMGSTHQSDTCLKIVSSMKLKGKEAPPDETDELVKGEERQALAGSETVTDTDKLVFYDVEVFPNLFLVNWKFEGEGSPVNRMINPSPTDVEELFKLKLVGFNCRKYDNHMLYGCYIGMTPAQLYDLSRRIIVEQAKSAFFPEAYDISYTDVYDFCSKKQSLKKWEIELGIHHQELGLPWDEPVPEEMWEKVAEYCDNDVIATEAVFNARKADFVAREILADIAGMKVNDTTNSLTTRIIFGKEKHPRLVYVDLAKGISDPPGMLPKGVVNSFPGYEWIQLEDGKWHNMYRGVDVSMGGYVYSDPGIYPDVALLDVASLHPHSATNMNYFGDFTPHFQDLLDARIHIKHGEFDNVRAMFDGKLEKYLDDPGSAKALAGALKIAINSVYGLTSASFDNPFRDKRNVNNIIALRGALFMKTLQDEVTDRGYKVIHIKTDSIKIANADRAIIDFCMDFAKKYGYTFEHEATYERICLIDKAQYIARYADPAWCLDRYGYIPEDNGSHGGDWTATGAEFQHPYIFKTLFSGEPVIFDDYCETKAVSGTGEIYLDMNEKLTPQPLAEDELDRRRYNALHPLKAKKLNPDYAGMSDEALEDLISTAHDYRFVGRVGRFFPVRPGCGGGVLYRKKDGKYFSVTGTKGYRWLEAEEVKLMGREDDLDPRYHADLVTEAIAFIEQFGPFERFIDISVPWVPPEPFPETVVSEEEVDDLPFDLVPCGDGKRNNCMECPHCHGDTCDAGYSIAVN